MQSKSIIILLTQYTFFLFIVFFKLKLVVIFADPFIQTKLNYFRYRKMETINRVIFIFEIIF